MTWRQGCLGTWAGANRGGPSGGPPRSSRVGLPLADQWQTPETSWWEGCSCCPSPWEKRSRSGKVLWLLPGLSVSICTTLPSGQEREPSLPLASEEWLL